MARYTGPRCRLCRREGRKLFLKGERCYTEKCAIEKKAGPPGQHGKGYSKETEYGSQLREKQKVKRIYGVLERQFRNYFSQAEKQRGITGNNLLQLLETRLDNVVYRLGFASSRSEARQLVLHNHFTVNGGKVNIPSYQVKKGDIIQIREKSIKSPKFQNLLGLAEDAQPPVWLEASPENMTGRVIDFPTREDIDADIEEHLIVELYSR